MMVGDVIVSFLGLYMGIGLIFGLLFILVFMGRIDSSAAGASWPVRLIVLPGAILIWPIMLMITLARGIFKR